MFLTIIVFIVILGLLVFVHEFGHFIVAKLCKVGVEEFGFGFPPRIFGWKKGETTYSLNWIPIGGFVKIKGIVGADQDNAADDKADDSFMTKPIWQRFSILFAGVFMNFILCGLLFSVGYIIGLPSLIENVPASAHVQNMHIAITEILPDTPAAAADLQAGDIINQINGQQVNTITDLKKNINQQTADSNVKLKIERNDQLIDKDVKIVKIANNNELGIGVYLTETGTVSFPWYEAIYRGFKQTILLIGMIFAALWNIIYSLITSGKTAADFSGPIGIAVLTDEMTKMGFIYVLQFTALLSINLAIFNLLPLPALDGGRLLFLIIEKLRGKPTNQKIEAIIHNIGFALLILLVILVTFRDISKYEIINHVKNLFT